MNKLDYLAEYLDIQPSLFRESDTLNKLIEVALIACDDQQTDLLWLAENLLNIDLAEGYHLDLIGGIVGQPRFLSDFNTEPYFGFENSYQSKSFGTINDPSVGGYWNSRSHFNTATSRTLSDEEYRRIIKARVIYNQSNCTANDLLEVVNLVTNRKDNTVQMLHHGLIQVRAYDETGILAYFIDRVGLEDNILPVAAGVRVGLDSSTTSEEEEEVELYWDNVTNLIRLNGNLYDDKKEEGLIWEDDNNKGVFVDSRFGKSLDFNGTELNMITTPFNSSDSDSLALAETFTIEFFAKVSSENSGTSVIMSSGEAEFYGGRDLSWWVSLNNSSIRFIASLSGSGGDTRSVGASLPEKDYSEDFSHFAITYDNSGMLNFYVDGSLIKSSAFTNTFNSTDGTQLSIGGLRYRGYDYPFKGTVGQVRITRDIVRYEGESFKAPKYFPLPTT